MKLIYKIIVPILVIAAMALLLVGFLIVKNIEQSIIKEKEGNFTLSVLRNTSAVLKKDYFTLPVDKGLLEKKLEEFSNNLKDVSGGVKDISIVRINVWNKNGEIIFSDEKSLIGVSFSEKEELAAVFKGKTSAKFKTPSLKDQTVPPFSKFADIFIPIRFEAESEPVAAVEIISVADTLLEPVKEVVTNIIIGLGAVFLLISGVSFLVFSRFIIAPVKFLEEAAGIVREGNLDYQIGSDSSDEIGNLTRAFDRMRESLKGAAVNLKKNLKQDEAILNSMEEAVVALSLDLKITLFNKMAEKMSGWKALQVLGNPAQNYLKFVSEEGKQEVNLLEEFIERKEPYSISGLLLRSKTGAEIPIGNLISPILDDRGDIMGFILVLRDITKEAEMDRAKSEFIRIASHEMRTPLSTIKSYAESFLSGAMGKLTEDQMNFIGQIHSSNEAAIDLVNNLLLISSLRLDEKFEVKPADADFVVAGNVARLGVLAKAKNIDLVYKKPETPLPHVSINSQLFSHAFKNILDNAIKYTPGKGHIEVGYEVKSKELVIFVKDSGIGIPEADQPRVFEKFYRSKQAYLLYPTGIGLGLAATKAIIEGMKGSIWFESKVGAGSKFYISLPRV